MARIRPLITFVAVICTGLSGTSASGQQPPNIVQGVVHDSSHMPLRGAEVVLGTDRALTGADGRFQLLGIKGGAYPLLVRSVGFVPFRTTLEISDSKNRDLTIELAASPVRLPTLVTEAARPGIAGIVHDPALRPIPGARVQVEGVNGGTIFTDSLGQFALPKMDRGYVLMAVTRPGYSGRRVFLELERGHGQVIDVTLSPGPEGSARQEEVALFDFKHRLLLARTLYWMPQSQLRRYGTAPLCDVPRVRAALGRAADGEGLVVLLNGIAELRGVSLCHWTADEVDLVEMPPPPRQAPRSISPRPVQSRTVVVVLWEKR